MSARSALAPEAEPAGVISPSTQTWQNVFALVKEIDALGSREEKYQRISEIARAQPRIARDAQALLGLGDGDGATELPPSAELTTFLKTASSATVPLQAGDIIQNYTLTQPLGRGGMADVWLARRNDGTLDRSVALKLPLAMMSAAALVERFRRERDILAQLDHPNIAKIFDAGTTAQGQPFLALEYIDGVALNQYCAQKRLGLRERVQLIVHAAHAAHHAHSRLVLHRDIKPSNMMVTKEGALKLLDFGIAKLLTTEQSAEETQFTRMNGVAMTPKYAAPEQLVGETVTTATDTFSLAVVLFELITGSVPFQNDAKEMSARIAQLDQSPRTLAQAPESAPQVSQMGFLSIAAYRRALKGDISFVLSKALRRNPGERYSSALAFAADLQRTLDNRPVAAREGATIYRIEKYLRRNWASASIAAVGGLAVIAFAGHAFQQRAIATESQTRAKSVDGLMASFLAGMSPDMAKSRTFTAKELLDRAQSFLNTSGAVSAQGGEIANARMGELYRDIGEYTDAVKIFTAQREAAQQRKDPRAEIAALWNLIDIHSKANQHGAATPLLAAAHELAAAHLRAPDLLLAKLSIAQGQRAWLQNKSDDAEKHYAAAEAQLKSLQPPDVELLVWAIEGQAIAARTKGNLADARQRFQAVQALDAAIPVRGEIDRLRTQSHLAVVDYIDGRFAQASGPLRAVCDTFQSRLGNAHAETVAACQSYTFCAIRQGQWDAAEAMLARLRAATPLEKEGQHQWFDQLGALALMYRGQPAQAESALRAIVLRHEKAGAGESDAGLRARRVLAENILRQGKTDDATAQLRIIEAKQIEMRGEKHPDVALTRVLLGIGDLRQGRIAQAQQQLSAAALVLQKERGEHHPSTISAQTYAALAQRDNIPTAQIGLAQRLESALGWQAGAQTLIERLNQPQPSTGAAFTQLPVVL